MICGNLLTHFVRDRYQNIVWPTLQKNKITSDPEIIYLTQVC